MAAASAGKRSLQFSCFLLIRSEYPPPAQWPANTEHPIDQAKQQAVLRRIQTMHTPHESRPPNGGGKQRSRIQGGGQQHADKGGLPEETSQG